MLWIKFLKMICSLDACTTQEMKVAVEWVHHKANQNRPVLALVNATGEALEIIKQAKEMVENKTKDVALISKVTETLTSAEASLDRILKLMFAEGQVHSADDATLIEMLKSAAFLKDIEVVVGSVTECNQTWKQATPGMQEQVQGIMTQVHTTVSAALVRFSEPLRRAVVKLHEAFVEEEGKIKWFDSEEGTPTTEELMNLNDVTAVDDLFALLSAFSLLALDVMKMPCPQEVISLASVNEVAQHVLHGIVLKASIHQIHDAEKCLPFKLQTLEHFKKAVTLADSVLGLEEAKASHDEINLLKASAVKKRDEVLNTVGQNQDVTSKFNASLLRSAVESDDEKLLVWAETLHEYRLL